MNSTFQDDTSDRLSVTLIFAVLLHGALILGLGFSVGLSREPVDTLSALDVILVQKSATEAPERTDFLAQANQLGGGTKEERLRPTAPLTGPALKPESGIAHAPARASAPQPAIENPRPVLTRDESEREVPSAKPSEKKPLRQLPTTAELMFQAREIARLEAQLDEDIQAYAERARHKYISANTREYLYASYMQSWVDKVERIGNLNYPAEARKKNVQGNLILDVAIDWSGEVTSIEVLESSGYEILDAAAIRIVRLAAPYTPLPDDIRAVTDILHITRTWQFLPGDQFGSE